tara:strand:- start:782 stop:1819 length:1038 start_codon:yes stop_codon:yes gene_type:complete
MHSNRYPRESNFCIFLFLSFLLLSCTNVYSQYPENFDSLGPTVQSLSNNNKTIYYIDDGKDTDTPVVFIGGLGTSVRAIRLLDFLRSYREELGLRFISIERNGFGQTPFNPDFNMNTYIQDVIAILNHLDIEKFSLFGISGGGPYASKIASIIPERIESMHMAATLPVLGTKDRCSKGKINNIYKDIIKYPMKYFAFSSNSPVHQVDGFQDTAYDEAARTFFLNGQMANIDPLDHELTLFCNEGIINTESFVGSVYVYAGKADPLIGEGDIENWEKFYPNADVIKRIYPGEGHDVQYRHLDQILIDIKYKKNELLICENEKNLLLNSDQLDHSEEYQLGLCIWQD